MSVKNLILGLAISLLSAGAAKAQAKPFSQQLKLQGVTFNVNCPNEGPVNTVTITTVGLARNKVIKREVKGVVTGAEVADLNVDRSPEIYIYAASTGSERFGQLIALSSNKKKSLSDIYLPEIAPGSKESVGYSGHDDFAVVENTFVRRFPIYSSSDSNAKPTGKMRQFQYKLKPGEAGWILAVDKVIEY
jgi:hypothetical protein